MTRRIGLTVFVLVAMLSVAAAGQVPLIHCTDILYPPDDPDDYFDLACVYAVPEYDLKLVVLDQGEKQTSRPGSLAVEQMNQLKGRKVASAVGLNSKLTSPDDKGLTQPEEFQVGVRQIVRVLRESTSPVTMSVVGSARDVAAAFNREPELFRKKVSRIYVFCGEASDPKFVEWNVNMDPKAFAGLMRSGLPICWIPCFDHGQWENGGHASFWVTTQSLLLARAPEPLLQYFISATQPVTSEPLAFLRQPVKAEHKEKLFATPRNMWGGALLALGAGRRIARGEHGYEALPVPPGSPLPASSEVVSFREVSAGFTDDGLVRYDAGLPQQRIALIEIKDRALYGKALTEATAALLAQSVERIR